MTRIGGARLTGPWTLVVGKAVATKDDESPAGAAPKPASAHEAEIEHNRAQLESMRQHLRAYGGAVAALATAVLAGVGWATLTAIAPVPEGQERLIVAAGICALLALGGSVLLVGLFFAAQRRIVFDTDTIPDARASWDRSARRAAKQNNLTRSEARAARAPLDDLATEELAADITAVERRQHRLARSARRYAALAASLDADSSERAVATARAERLQAAADRLAGAHRVAAVQAVVRVLETRQRKVFHGAGPRALSLLIVIGIVGLFVVADYSRGARALDAARLACADKLVALAGADLTGYSCDARGRLQAPQSVGTDDDEETETPTADLAVLERLATCEETITPPDPATAVDGWESRASAAIALCAGLPAPAAAPADAAAP